MKIHSEARTIDGVGDVIGGVALSDDQWQQAFVALSDRAGAIVMAPGASEGVITELTSLKDRNLLPKCAFVLRRRIDDQRRWRKSQQGLAHVDVVLPEGLNDYRWTAFRVNASQSIVDLRQFSLKRLGANLEDIVADVIGDNSPLDSWRRNVIVRRWHRFRGLVWMLAIGIAYVLWSLTRGASHN